MSIGYFYGINGRARSIVRVDASLHAFASSRGAVWKSGPLAIARRNAQTFIPPRKNAKPWKSTQTGSASRNEAQRFCQRFGRRIWKKWSGYQRRSLVVTKMNCFKRLAPVHEDLTRVHVDRARAMPLLHAPILQLRAAVEHP